MQLLAEGVPGGPVKPIPFTTPSWFTDGLGGDRGGYHREVGHIHGAVANDVGPRILSWRSGRGSQCGLYDEVIGLIDDSISVDVANQWLRGVGFDLDVGFKELAPNCCLGKRCAHRLTSCAFSAPRSSCSEGPER